ncbi:MAG: HAMP domain-containing histidine kinase [Acaryochloridaceae cyanobacterium SU_2_1]|nr:HAMP domain-containing histidine kinase [Acaryochloridaceae cyanobacterium SU_2_1]
MIFLGFLVGLGIGLSLWLGSMRQFNRRLAAIIDPLTSHTYGSALSPFSRLLRLTQQYERDLQAVVEEVENWKTILSNAPVGYLQVNASDQLYWLNQRAGELLNIPDALVENRQEHIPPLFLKVIRSLELDQLIHKVRRDQQRQQLDWLLHIPSRDDSETAQKIPLRAYGLPLAQGHVGLYVEDRQEANTLRAERDRWTSDVAHELKTPLTAIRLMAEALADQVDLPHRSRLERLLQEVLRLSDLVQDLLELSRITFNQSQSLQLERVDLPELIQKAWLSLEPLAQRNNLFLYYQGPNSLTIEADAKRLYRVFLNLMDNAIQYSPPDQPIIVQLSRQSSPPLADSAGSFPQSSPLLNQVYVDVIDSGFGFAEEAIPFLFQRFYRFDPSRARFSLPAPAPRQLAPILALESKIQPPQPQPLPSSSGSGLGLAIAQQIVVAHGGLICASNHPQTGGAWLQIQLPIP